MRWNEPTPGEHEARSRTWDVVQAAFAERTPSPHRRDWRPFLVIAVGAALLAAAFSPPGLAVLGSLRDAVRGEKNARSGLTSLPAPGRVLVNAASGVWVVQQDGSKRFLPGYVNASWSPRGLYLAAGRENELVAMEPNGRIHWTLARGRPIGSPIWSDATPPCCRIAYLSGPSLRVVNGDGTGDHLIARRVSVTVPALAWRPGTHQLTYANNRGQLVLLDADRNRMLWRRPIAGVERLLWSRDGRRLLVVSGRSTVLDGAGRLVATLPAHGVVLGAASVPRSEAFALATLSPGRGSTVVVYRGPRYGVRRTLFSGAGLFAGLAWSPDARWLLVDWRSADQWIFIRSTAVRRVIAVSNIGRTFDSGPEHYASVESWCCP